MLRKVLYLSAIVAACGIVAGCNRNTDNSGGVSPSVSEETNSVSHPSSSTLNSTFATISNSAVNAAHDVNNTAKNIRDRAEGAVTPLKQGENAADLDMTQKIRQAVTDDSSLSTTAKNVKIITLNGKVTLRGPVESTAEKQKIESIAQGIAAGQVDDQLEIKAQNQ